MNLDWKHWLLGLAAAFIGGGAGAVSAGVSAAVITPEQYNLGAGLTHTLQLMTGTFIVSGILGAFLYLKQSPVPREVWTEAERKAQNGTPPAAIVGLLIFLLAAAPLAAQFKPPRAFYRPLKVNILAVAATPQAAPGVQAAVCWDYNPALLPAVAGWKIYRIEATGPNVGARILPELGSFAGGKVSVCPQSVGVADPLNTAIVTLPFGNVIVEVVAIDSAGAEGEPERVQIFLRLPKVTGLRIVG